MPVLFTRIQILRALEHQALYSTGKAMPTSGKRAPEKKEKSEMLSF
jgi:hypothetical protein